MKNALIIFLLLISTTLFSQEVTQKEVKGNKGKMFVYWGWNRANYSNSDIHFKGSNYDFVLKDVEAKDKPSPFAYDPYFKIDEITIPQTNFRIGYFFHDNYNVSIGIDHMKYVMKNYETVLIDGMINTGGEFDGTYANDPILLTYDFLKFEHTDGLNYVNIEVNRFDSLNKWLKINSKDFVFALTEGLGIGVLYPKTNTTLLGKEKYDEFHVSGYGLSAKVGLNLTAFKYFFVQSEFKGGYINMSNIRTTADKIDEASQKFTFFEKNIVFGVRFNLTK